MTKIYKATDEIVFEALWKEFMFMQKLVFEWTEFVLYASTQIPLLAQNTHVLTLVNPTVDSDACCKCCVSNYPRCYCRLSVPTK